MLADCANLRERRAQHALSFDRRVDGLTCSCRQVPEFRAVTFHQEGARFKKQRLRWYDRRDQGQGHCCW
jgi:hypothetical protein